MISNYVLTMFGLKVKTNFLRKSSSGLPFQRRVYRNRRVKSESINQVIYREECLKKRVLPFINEFHFGSDYIFLTTSHYAKDNISWMEENINFVAKSLNPPNVPQARLIENFWGCLTQKVFDGGWQANTEDQLIRRIKNKLKEFDIVYLQSLMKGVTAKLCNIADNGVFSYLKP